MRATVLLLAVALAHGTTQIDDTVLLQVAREEHRPAAAISREAKEDGAGESEIESASTTCSNAKQSEFRVWCDELSGFDLKFNAIDERLSWCNIAPTDKIGKKYDTDKMCYSADVVQFCKKAYDECSATKEDAAACCVKIGSKRTGGEQPVLTARHKKQVDNILVGERSTKDASHVSNAKSKKSKDDADDVADRTYMEDVMAKRETACNDIVQSTFRGWCDELNNFDLKFNAIDERLQWCDIEPTTKVGPKYDTDKMCYELGRAEQCREAYNSCTATKEDAAKCCVKIATRRTAADSSILASTDSHEIA